MRFCPKRCEGENPCSGALAVTGGVVVRQRKMSTVSDAYEPVSAAGELYDLPASLAHGFARVKGIEDPQNFARAMDPAGTRHHFVEHWQALYNVRWLEKLGTDGKAVEWMLVWGQPKHSMKDFYLMAKGRWPELSQGGSSSAKPSPRTQRRR